MPIKIQMMDTVAVLTSTQLETICTTAATKAVQQFQKNLSIQANKAPEDIGGIDMAVSITGKAKSTIYKLTSTGGIPCYRKGHQLLFSRKKLIAWIEEGEKPTAKEVMHRTDKNIARRK